MAYDFEFANKPLIVLVDDQQEILTRFSDFFRKDHSFEVLTAANAEDAISCIEGITRPAVVLLDRNLVDNDGSLVHGEDILPVLKARARFPITTIFFTADDSVSAELHAIRAGADWFLVKGCDTDLLVAYIWRAVHFLCRLLEPNKDPLTGALNRRAMFERAIIEMSRAERFTTTIACMMFDIDNFKPINDKYGHCVGDRVIVSVVNSLQEQLRTIDVVCRWGGDEIFVLLCNVQADNITTLTRNFLGLITKRRIPVDVIDPMSEEIAVSVSIGVALLTPEMIRCAQDGLGDGVDRTPSYMNLLQIVINEADAAMYKEKKGRGKGK